MGISIRLIIRKDNYDNEKKRGTTIRSRQRHLLCFFQERELKD